MKKQTTNKIIKGAINSLNAMNRSNKKMGKQLDDIIAEFKLYGYITKD